MVHFELAQDRFARPHQLKAFELPQSAVKDSLEASTPPRLGKPTERVGGPEDSM